MGITNNAEEFLLRILNFEIVFEFAEKTDYLFLYKIKECIKHSECPEGAYLSDVANYMDLSMPATSKMITNLEKKATSFGSWTRKRANLHCFDKQSN